jgi:hypothetical protein
VRCSASARRVPRRDSPLTRASGDVETKRGAVEWRNDDFDANL